MIPDIFNPTVPFEEKALGLFRYQLRYNPVYPRFCDVFGYREDRLPDPDHIPLLPIRAFKETTLLVTGREAELMFRSSGTSEMAYSSHYIADAGLYRESVCRGFDWFYPDDAMIWAYLPGYMENPESSLVWMLDALIARDVTGMSRFLTEEEIPGLFSDGVDLSESRPLILFGAAFGLLDLIEQYSLTLPELAWVIETGGMKTHRRELSREDLHHRLAKGFGVSQTRIHSEYGMCELLSQAYAKEDGWFEPVPWMKVTIRDADNPGRICDPGEEGKIGVVDLANVHSCPFILTDDRGVAGPDGRFRVLGRWHPENMRGCNFLIDKD